MFNDSKYTRWYYLIIAAAKSRPKITGYKERHHIIPKSFGGSNDKSNLVDLTGREHFVCHLLLVKMTTSDCRYKMACAIMRMSKSGDLTSRTYQWVKKEFASLVSERHLGKPLSEEHKRKIAEAGRGRKQNPDWVKQRTTDVWTGRSHSDIAKAKMSKSHKGLIPAPWKNPEEVKHKLREWNAKNKPSLGLKRNESTKQKLSELNAGAANPNYGKRWWNDGKTSKLATSSPGVNWSPGRTIR